MIKDLVALATHIVVTGLGLRVSVLLHLSIKSFSGHTVEALDKVRHVGYPGACTLANGSKRLEDEFIFSLDDKKVSKLAILEAMCVLPDEVYL